MSSNPVSSPAGVADLAKAAARRRPEIRILFVALAAVVAIALFAGLAGEIREGDVFAIDRIILLAFREPGHLDIAIGPRWVQESARDITALGGFTVLTLVTLVATLVLALYRRRAEALVFVGAVVFAQIAGEALKSLIDRPRPTLVRHLDLVYSSSFPSGHALMTPVVYLLLATIIAAGEPRRALKTIPPACAGVLVVAVGVSRVYLGVHWPTDVLAGWTLGIAIALAASIILHRLALQPSERPAQPQAPRARSV